MKIKFILFLLITGFITGQSDSLYAGFRASRIKSSYPNNQFPDKYYWQNAGDHFSAMFPNSQAAGIWIVSLYIEDGITQLNFPNPGGNYEKVWFIGQDQNESYLDYFDQHGLKVWLQVEPGGASVDTLMHIILTKYGHHPCVIGFGVDVEWLDTHLYSGGRQVTDIEAARWENKVKSFNPNYSLFLKHYTPNRMPDNYRGELIFVDDSQMFNSFTQMINEFKVWGNKFPSNPVAFQYGYPADKFWWQQLTDPPKTIGDKLIEQIPNCSGLFWVDFTINDIFPVTSIEYDNSVVQVFEIIGNYPNPFNPSTSIKYTSPRNTEIKLVIYNNCGQEIIRATGVAHQGENNIEINLEQHASGIYYYSLFDGANYQWDKMVLLK